MKYKPGDKVRIKSLDWYKANECSGPIVDVKYEDNGFGGKDCMFYVKDLETEHISKFAKCDLKEEVINVVYKPLS